MQYTIACLEELVNFKDVLIQRDIFWRGYEATTVLVALAHRSSFYC